MMFKLRLFIVIVVWWWRWIDIKRNRLNLRRLRGGRRIMILSIFINSLKRRK